MGNGRRGPIGIDGSPSPNNKGTGGTVEGDDELLSGDDGSAYERPPRRPRSERKAFDAISWLLEGITGLSEEIQHNDLGLSEEFWTHAYAARKETLLAVRALVDNALEQCETEADAPPTKPRRGKVDIAFGDSSDDL